MKVTRRLVRLLAAGAVLFGFTASVTPVSAVAPTIVPAASLTVHGTKPTIVLVHGVFADASGWSATITKLLDLGFPVLAVANPLRDLDGDAAYVSSIVDTLPGPVIMVGHSYGGAVITNAARGHANVKALVYVAAFAPDEGESPLDLARKFPGSELLPALIARPYPLPGGGFGQDGYIDPAKFREVFAADLPSSVTRVMAVSQRPGSIGGLDGHSGVPAWKSLPSWFVIPSGDKVIPPAVQEFMAERAHGQVVRVRASHVAMMSRPDVTVRQILAAYTTTR